MKVFLLLTVLCIFATPSLSINLSSEFLTGFESGIFLRSNPSMMDDYGCPKAKTNTQEF